MGAFHNGSHSDGPGEYLSDFELQHRWKLAGELDCHGHCGSVVSGLRVALGAGFFLRYSGAGALFGDSLVCLCGMVPPPSLARTPCHSECGRLPGIVESGAGFYCGLRGRNGETENAGICALGNRSFLDGRLRALYPSDDSVL